MEMWQLLLVNWSMFTCLEVHGGNKLIIELLLASFIVLVLFLMDS